MEDVVSDPRFPKYSESVCEKVAHVKRIATQLGEDINNYPPVCFEPGHLLDEINAVIAEKEKELMESKRAAMNKGNVGLCLAFLRGNCAKGVTCSFSHTSESLVSYMSDWLRQQIAEQCEGTLAIVEEFGADAWGVLFNMLRNERLTSLVVRSLNREGMRVIVNGLGSNELPTITFLDLSKNSLCDVYPRGVLRLAKALATNPSLRVLSIGFNMLGSAGAVAVTQAFATSKNSTLEALNLCSNGIGSDEHAFPALCEAFSQCTSLTKIGLACNEIGPDGIRLLLDAFSKLERLEVLDLFNTSMGDQGANHIAQYVKANRTVRTINIGWNKLTSEGAVMVCSALESNDKLESLRMSYNPAVGRKGAVAISSLLKSSTSIVSLDVRWNSLGDDGVMNILEALGTNRTLRDVMLGGNDLDPRTEALIAERLKKNVVTSTRNAKVEENWW